MRLTELETRRLPSLRFPAFAGAWQREQFANVFSFKRTNSFSREDLNYEDGEARNIHYGDIHTQFRSVFDLSRETVPFVNSQISIERIPPEEYCALGDLVMADASEDYSDIGKSVELVNLDGQKVLAGLHTFLIRPRNSMFARGFLAYLMQSWKMRLQIMTYAQGTKVLGIPKQWLSKIFLDFPDQTEQQRIAVFFMAVDEKISLLKKQIDLLIQYKAGAMQQIFDQTFRFKDANGSEFPDWEEKRLSEVSRINPRTGVLPSEFTYIDLESVEDGRLNKEEIIRAEDAPSRAQRVLKKGDILFQVVRPYQKNNFLFDRDGDYVASTGYAQIRAKINTPFLFQTILSYGFVKDVVRRCTGTSYPAINSDDLSKIVIKVPSMREQEKIGTFLSSIDDRINSVNMQLEKMLLFKKGLLQQMFV